MQHPRYIRSVPELVDRLATGLAYLARIARLTDTGECSQGRAAESRSQLGDLLTRIDLLAGDVVDTGDALPDVLRVLDGVLRHGQRDANTGNGGEAEVHHHVAGHRPGLGGDPIGDITLDVFERILEITSEQRTDAAAHQAGEVTGCVVPQPVETGTGGLVDVVDDAACSAHGTGERVVGLVAHLGTGDRRVHLIERGVYRLPVLVITEGLLVAYLTVDYLDGQLVLVRIGVIGFLGRLDGVLVTGYVSLALV